MTNKYTEYGNSVYQLEKGSETGYVIMKRDKIVSTLQSLDDKVETLRELLKNIIVPLSDYREILEIDRETEKFSEGKKLIENISGLITDIENEVKDEA